MHIRGCKYFSDAWNYIDLLPLFLMIGMCVWTAIASTRIHFGFEDKENYEVSGIRDYIQSLNAILMWFKFAYFLRATEQTGWLIRMIGEVVVDLGPFLVVMLISILAFTDAFSSMSLA